MKIFQFSSFWSILKIKNIFNLSIGHIITLSFNLSVLTSDEMLLKLDKINCFEVFKKLACYFVLNNKL